MQSDSVADVGMIEMANWVDVDPLNGIDANDLLREVPSAVRMARHAGLPRGSQADRGDLASGIRLTGGNGGAGSGMSARLAAVSGLPEQAPVMCRFRLHGTTLTILICT